MKILLTGATGFVGKNLVKELLLLDYSLLLLVRNKASCQNFEWYSKVEIIEYDLTNEFTNEQIDKISKCNRLIHLAWQKLPNYKELFHIEESLMINYFFIKKVVQLGIKDITITGTCLEYGLQEGCLSVENDVRPDNPYALAKHTLHLFLLQLMKFYNFKLKWLRLFYMYGEGQSENSVIPQLYKALEEGRDVFNLSGGEQVRDYLDVKEVVRLITKAAIEVSESGVYNVCSGEPITIRQLIQNHVKASGKSIELNFGFYPYNDYEPFNFYGKKNL